MDIWFIADTHFGHKNIIEYCDRPFASVEEMNEILIENWNKRVKPDDVIYHLGDVFLCSVEKEREIMNRLNGNKKLFLGNHDKGTVTHYKELGFDVLCDRSHLYYKNFTYKNEYMAYLSHRPIPIDHTFNIHAHVHNKVDNYEKIDPHTYKCVSVENIGYKPIHVDEIFAERRRRYVEDCY